MNREETEILIARYFDGGLSAAEKAALDEALAGDRECAELFAEQESAHRDLGTLRLNWALPADFASGVVLNLPPLEKEKLIARFFDGDLSAVEQEHLKREIAHDPHLANLFKDQQLAHRDLEALKLRWSLPADFAPQVVLRLPKETAEPAARIYALRWRQIALAASVALVAGLIFAMSYISQPTQLPEIAKDPLLTLSPVSAKASIFAYSGGEMRVEGADGTVVDRSFRGDVALPATIAAPHNTHVVVNVGNGTAVIPGGARAELDRVDGRVAIKPITGDLYLESGADGVMDASVADVSVSVQRGGVTLRRRGNDYLAEPSHGSALLKGRGQTTSIRASELQVGLIGHDGAIQVQKGEAVALDDWAAAGRADELKREVLKLLKLKEGDINVERWNEFIQAMAKQPVERARHAAVMRFTIEEGLLEECTPEQQEAFAAIAKILAEGTTEDDVDRQTRETIRKMKQILKDPQVDQTRPWIKLVIKGWLDTCGRIARGEIDHRRVGRGFGHKSKEDVKPKSDSRSTEETIPANEPRPR